MGARIMKTNTVSHLDPQQSVKARVRCLLEKMSLEDKIRQMGMSNSLDFSRQGRFCPALAQKFFQGFAVGALKDPRFMEPKTNAKLVNAVQRFLVNKTRLGIPALIVSECLHGHMSKGATIFPQVIGLASTWNPDLIRKMAAVAAREARAVGVTQALAPDLDLARDPRWGRVEETYGEDPYLCARFAVAYVKGLQGEGPIVDREHIIATTKHFAAHGSPEGGLNLAPVATGPRELRSLYLPPFKAAITEAGALSVMPAYSEIDGVPCSASKLLLTRILREQWGFQGHVISDFGAIPMLLNMHHTAPNLAEAGKQALTAGVDLEAPNIAAFGTKLLKLVRKGDVSMDLVDRAVSRILRAKVLTGLFENPYGDPKKAVEITNCSKHRKLARRIAQESVVLLKNAGRLLPLDRKVNSIAVIGPNADVAQLGNYSFRKEQVVSPLQGIRNAVSRRTEVVYAKGCNLFGLSKGAFPRRLMQFVAAMLPLYVSAGQAW